MDKLLYVSFENSENRASGVNKKISGQIEAFKKNGYAVDLAAVYAKNIAIYKEGQSASVVQSKSIPRVTLCSWVAKHAKDYHAAYIRFQFFCPFVLNMVKALHRNHVKTIMEIPTYPYINELKAQGLKGIPKKIIDSSFGKSCSRYIDAFATPLFDGEIYGKKTLVLYNGIDAGKVSPRSPHKDARIDLLAVAMMSPWHGYDRMIEGIHEYYDHGGKREIVLYLVGEGAAIPAYQELIGKYSLEKQIILCGKKSGKELDTIYDLADIGVGALSSFRKGVYKTNTLKVLEYMAKGLPVICEEGEIGIPKDSKYRLSVPADNSPVDIESVIQFYDMIYQEETDVETVIQDIRAYCINSCSVEDGLKAVFDYLNDNNTR